MKRKTAMKVFNVYSNRQFRGMGKHKRRWLDRVKDLLMGKSIRMDEG